MASVSCVLRAGLERGSSADSRHRRVSGGVLASAASTCAGFPGVGRSLVVRESPRAKGPKRLPPTVAASLRSMAPPSFSPRRHSATHGRCEIRGAHPRSARRVARKPGWHRPAAIVSRSESFEPEIPRSAQTGRGIAARKPSLSGRRSRIGWPGGADAGSLPLRQRRALRDLDRHAVRSRS
jgi:hypothetical protein